jgi:ABC-type glycerol-3-phosphate transport system permease component
VSTPGRTLAAPRPLAGAGRAAGGFRPGRLALYLVAIIVSLLFLGPFVFTVGSALKAPSELYAFPPTLWPAVPQPQNFITVFQVPRVPFADWYLNTIVITLLAVVGTVISATAAAYGFARFRWPGRDLMFMVLLSTLVLPEEVVIIPKFLMFHLVPEALIGTTLIDTWFPLFVPSWFGGGAFYVFLLRQFFLQIPRELDEAAKIDGANSVQILFRVLLPLAGPALATVAIFAFLAHWNDFIHPLIYLNSIEKYPLSLGLRWFQQQPTDPTEPREHLLMAGSVLFTLPAIVIFFAMQRVFVRGIVMSGIKG